MTTAGGRPGRGDWLLPVALPLLLVVVILGADIAEGPKTAYVGVLTAVPMLAAVFGTPVQTGLVGAVTWLAALGFGLASADGNVGAQRVRLVIIAIAAVVAVLAARARAGREHELESAQRKAAEAGWQADRDPLTGLLNRRGMLSALEATGGGTWTLALADLDEFKVVNDDLGHLAGDEYLVACATRIARALSDHDLVARWGGDEFLVAVPLPADATAPILARVHQRVTREPMSTSAGLVAPSLTIGAAQWEPPMPLDEALQRADRALFRGKAGGRNRVESELC